MSEAFRRANVANALGLIAEVRARLAKAALRPGIADGALQAAGEAMARDFRLGNISFGEMVQALVCAVRNYVRFVEAVRPGMRASDARLARALSCHLDWEVRTLAAAFSGGMPREEIENPEACRSMLAWELCDGGFMREGVDDSGLPVFFWTQAGRSWLNAPKPLGPGDSRIARGDFEDLFATG